MMYDIVVIGDEDTVNGFRLAGVKRSFVADSKEVALRIIRENSDAGIIIITETLAEEMGDIERLKKGKVPIIVEIPDKKGPIEGRKERMRELIRKAVGIKME